jgi:glycosyltransferase involved in cell wall biosynthesis
MTAKRNILIMVGSFEMGGAESQAVLLARLLLEHGRYDVHMACLHRRGVLLDEASRLGLGEIPEFPLTSFYDRNMLVQLRRFSGFVKERAIHIAHSQDFYMNVFGIIGAARAGVPARIAFWGETGEARTGAQRFLQRRAFQLAHVVHANSLRVKKILVADGVPAKKIAVIYNGLDLARVETPPDFSRDEALARLGLPRAGRRFVTLVANLRSDVKDHQMFLRAARRVRDEVPEAAFVLAGEGELVEPVRALAAQLGLRDDVFLIGRCEHLAQLLTVSEVCALSSKSEGFSNAILEYMGAARPVVVTNVGGASEAVSDGETGYLVASGDDSAMAARIVSLLRDPARAREMGLRARHVLEQKFSSRAQLENTESLYDRLLAGPTMQGMQEGVGVRREQAESELEFSVMNDDAGS